MRSPLPLSKLLAATVAACALVPAAANAATVSEQNGALVFQADAGGVNLIVSDYHSYDNNADYLTFGDAATTTIQTSLCHTEQYSTEVLCEKSPTRPIQIIGSDANDSISIFGASHVPDSIPITIDGRGGNDQIKDSYDGSAGRTIIGGPGNDTLDGGPGDDKVDGGDGNDTVDGNAGNDEVHGGAGDDTIWGDHYKEAGNDILDGGPGTDTIDEWNDPSGDVHPLPTISQDGVANDGRPGESDNVTNIEKFDLHINATFVGSNADEKVTINNSDEGSANLSGGGGNDILKATDTSGDIVDGGSGDDQLEGGLGNDKITGGPGKDNIMGDSSSSYCSFLGDCKVPFGADEIWAKDGEADTIDCGIGDDTAHVDPIDTVQNCEHVDGQGGSGPAPGSGGDKGSGTGGGNPGGGSGGGGVTAKIALVGTAKVKTLLAGKLSVTVPCAAACRVTVNAKKGGKTVATGGATLLGAGTAKPRLKVSAKGKRALKHTKRLTLKISATITGADGKRTTLSRTVTLK